MTNWTMRPFGDLTVNLDRRRVPVRGPARKPGPYAYYGASGIVDWVDGYLFEGLHLLIAEDGENLRSRKTPIAFLADGKFWVNNHAHILVANESNDTRFLAYAMQATDIAGYITGSAQPKLNQAALSSIKINTPPLPAQRRIAATLGALDDKIESNRRVRRLLRQVGEAHLARAIGTGTCRRYKLAELTISISRGVAPKYSDDDSSTPMVLNQRCIRDGWVALTSARRMIDRQLPAAKLGCTGDILVNSTGTGTLGRVGRWHEGEIFVDGHVSVVKPNPQVVGPTVLAYALFGRESDIEDLATGSTGQTELSPTRLGALPVALPSGKSMAELESALLAVEREVFQLSAEIDRLIVLRDALLPELLSGRIRVPVEASS